MSDRIVHLECREITLALPWLVNGSLVGQEAREVREHLIRCPGCREELRETRRVLAMFHVAEETSRRSAAPRVARPRRGHQVLRWAAVVLVLLGVALVFQSLAPDLDGPPSQEGTVTASGHDLGGLLRDGFESRDLGRWSLPDGATVHVISSDGFETRDLSHWSSPDGGTVRN